MSNFAGHFSRAIGIAFPLLLMLMSSCGGGGGSHSQLTPLVYDGNSEPAVITLENATTLVANVLYAGDSSSSLPTAPRPDADAMASETPGLIRNDFVTALSDSILASLNLRGLETTDIQQRIDVDEPLFCMSGSASMTGALDETTGLGTLTLTYNDCLIDGFLFDGVATLTIHEFDFSFLLPTDSTIDITLMDVAGFGFSGSVSGAIRLQISPNSGTEIMTLNYVARDNTTARMYRYENLVVTSIFDSYFSPTSLVQTWAGNPGRSYDSLLGYVEIDTPVALLYSSLANPYPDYDGVVTFTGAGGASIRLTVLTVDQIQLELDLDGLPGYEHSRVLTWDALALDAQTNLADIDASQVLRVPLSGNTLTGFSSEIYIGQTFTRADFARLQNLTFYLNSPSGIDFHVLLVTIDPAPVPHPTGVLFESPLVSVPAGLGLTPVTVDLAATAISAGQTYAWILDAYVTWQGLDQYASTAVTSPDPYNEGSYIHSETYVSHSTSREENFAGFWYEDTQYDMSFVLEYTSD